MIYFNPWMVAGAAVSLFLGVVSLAMAEDLHRGNSPFVVRMIVASVAFTLVAVVMFCFCWTRIP